MLFDPARHEPCTSTAWSESRARDAIEHIVRDAEARFSPERLWPIHPRDAGPGDDVSGAGFTPLYFGACGVFWALQHLQSLGAATLERSYEPFVEPLLSLNRTISNLESLTRKLSDQPSAVLLPSTPVPDPIPEARKQ